MAGRLTQREKAEVFRKLHHPRDILVLPNVWDPLGAALLESLDYPAVATASASVALTHGYPDGERIPFEDVFVRLKAIVNSVDLPITADIESGYAATESQLEENIKRLLGIGIVGINLEDHDKHADALYTTEAQCKRILAVRKIADAMGIPLFINARTDVYLRGKNFTTAEEKLQETLERGKAYLDAGADGIFPPGIKNKEEIATLVSTLNCPVNIIAFPGIPDFKTLREVGVARVSLGPGFLKIAVRAMKQIAVKLKNYQGLDEVLNNEVTSEDLKRLIVH